MSETKIIKILILTSVYPADDMQKAETPVVHYFAREWVKSGNVVEVLHMPFNLPTPFFYVVKLFRKQLSAAMGIIVRTKPVSRRIYNMDGVNILRLPLMKIIPHGRYSKRQIKWVLEHSIKYYDSKGFNPDVIISHWGNPQLEIMHSLKKKYHVPTVYVAHNSGEELMRAYKKELPVFFRETDIIGFRSAAIERQFKKLFCYEGPSFMCYSGIPESCFNYSESSREFSKIHKFIYVGTLIKRKYPSIIIPAVKKSFGNSPFSITYIGQGEEIENVATQARQCHSESNVNIVGYVERDKVVDYLKDSDVFIMISRNETYGLVYLEAMAAGCITIASRNEGFDGIIVHGYNGFLCEAGNEEELTELITEIRKMPKEELIGISENAKKTAYSLTDKKAAESYLNSIRKVI